MKNWLPAVPRGSVEDFAIATTPSVYSEFAGGTSTTVYPGPPRPVPVGSPPWMTKPGTILWKIVPSKKCFRTSAANDDVVHGESWTSRRNANSPRFLSTSTVCGCFGSSSGKVTWAPVVVQRLCVFALACPLPPHAASRSTAAASDSCASRATGRSRWPRSRASPGSARRPLRRRRSARREGARGAWRAALSRSRRRRLRCRRSDSRGERPAGAAVPAGASLLLPVGDLCQRAAYEGARDLDLVGRARKGRGFVESGGCLERPGNR